MYSPAKLDIKEQIEEEKMVNPVKKQGEVLSNGGIGLDESEGDVDGLLKWARNLPDDIPNTS